MPLPRCPTGPGRRRPSPILRLPDPGVCRHRLPGAVRRGLAFAVRRHLCAAGSKGGSRSVRKKSRGVQRALFLSCHQCGAACCARCVLPASPDMSTSRPQTRCDRSYRSNLEGHLPARPTAPRCAPFRPWPQPTRRYPPPPGHRLQLPESRGTPKMGRPSCATPQQECNTMLGCQSWSVHCVFTITPTQSSSLFPWRANRESPHDFHAMPRAAVQPLTIHPPPDPDLKDNSLA